MQSLTELRMYEELGKVLKTAKEQFNEPDFDVTDLEANDLNKMSEAFEALFLAIGTQKGQPQAYLPNVFDAIREHMDFWRNTELPDDVLNAIEQNQQPLPGQQLDVNLRNAWCDYTADQVTNLWNESVFTPVRQKAGENIFDSSGVPYRNSQFTHDCLTSDNTFNQQASYYRFNTAQEKAKFRQIMLGHWLSLQALESDFNTTRSTLLDIVNAPDNKVRHKMRDFASQCQNPNAQQPNPQIDVVLYNQLGDGDITRMRMKVLERVISNETNLETIKSLVNGEDAAWRSMGINNTKWMTVDQKDALVILADNRLIVLEQNPAEKAANQNLFNGKVDRLNYITVPQRNMLKWIFENLSVTEQQAVLQKSEQPIFFEKIFQATSPEALRYYLGIKEDHILGNPHLKGLTDRNDQIKSSINQDLARFFVENNVDFDPTALNALILRWYNTPYADGATALNALKEDVNRHFGWNNLQDQRLQWPPGVEDTLLDSAVILKDLVTRNLYDQNKSFYQYLLHAIPTELVDNQVNPPEARDRLISRLLTRFQNANTLNEFKSSLSDIHVEAWNVLIKMDESTFRELKNKTLTENLANTGLPENTARDAVIAQVLKRGHEQILKPLRDDFRRSQKSLEELSAKMIKARQLIEPAMGVREFASTHKDEMKRELLGAIEVAQQMERKLGRDITKLTDYKKALGEAAAKGGIRTPEFKEEYATVMRHLQELEQARDTWHQFREDYGLLTKAESTPAYPSIYMDITSAERESAQAESARFPFTARRVKPIQAVEIENYPGTVSPAPIDLHDEIRNPEKYSLTKKTDFVPVLKSGQMHELRVPYMNSAGDKEETMVFTKQSHGDGRFTTSLRSPPKSDAGQLEFITQAEWAIASQKRGNKFELSGKKGYVAIMYAIFIELGVPPSLIDTKSASAYDPKDTSSPEYKAAQAFIDTEDFKERIDISKKRLVEWRSAPQRADNVSLRAKGLLQGIIAEATPEIKAEDGNDYTPESPRT